MEIADEQGLAAVSMRAVAARVALTPMALYPYVGGKEGLLDGLVDRLLAELLPAATAAGEPVARLRALARAGRALARRHPAAYQLLLSRPAVTPDAVRVVDALYAALLDLGVPHHQVPRVERMLSTFTLGYATSEVNGRFAGGTTSPRARRAQFAAGELPAHAKLAEVLDAPVDWDVEYEADLDDLLFLIRRRWAA